MNTETINYKGYDIEIWQDDWVINPREEYDNLGTLALKNSGWADKNVSCEEDLFELLLTEEQMYVYDREYKIYDNHEYDTEKAWKNIDKEYIYLPVFKYEHSGIEYNTRGFNYPWDSGQTGWIYVSKKDVKKKYGWKVLTKERIEKIKHILECEVDTFSNCVIGEVYGFTIQYIDDIDSCGGFIGDHETSGLLETAHDSINWHINKLRKIKQERVKTLIKHRVPLLNREKLINQLTN